MSDQTSKVSRRVLLGGLGVSLATAAFSPVAFGEEQPVSKKARKAQPLQDPRTKYVRPPFKNQTQPWPALASKMSPRPDHGETTYVGSGRLLGRKALITGGDSGMGRAAAIAYAREGADVAITYLPFEQPDAYEVVKLIEAEGRKAVAIPGDLRDEAFCKTLIEDTVKKLGGLDILVSNAAFQRSHESIADISTEEFDQMIKTNIYAPFWLMKAALPHLKPGSTIIVTTSAQAEMPSPHLYHYALTKAANTSTVKSLAKQLGPKGIRVNGVAPGPVWTPLQVCSNAKPDDLKNFGGGTPLGRPGQPAELASIYVQLADGEASFANGQIYSSGGGATMP